MLWVFVWLRKEIEQVSVFRNEVQDVHVNVYTGWVVGRSWISRRSVYPWPIKPLPSPLPPPPPSQLPRSPDQTDYMSYLRLYSSKTELHLQRCPRIKRCRQVGHRLFELSKRSLIGMYLSCCIVLHVPSTVTRQKSAHRTSVPPIHPFIELSLQQCCGLLVTF